MYGSAYAHSSAMVNDWYALKGGLDTPGLMATAQEDNVAMDGRGADVRRRMRDGDARRTIGGANMTGPLARERNGVARVPSSPNGSQDGQQGWARMAFGLVGKAFTFGTSVIKGFYAGGGQGYEFTYQAQQSSPSQGWMRGRRYVSGGTPVPGAWRDSEEFLGDFEQDNPTHSPSSAAATRPSNKRRQTDKDAWVMVGTPEADVEQSTPKRKSSSQNVLRATTAGSRPSAASRVHSRRSLAPVSRRTSSYATHTNSPAPPQMNTDSGNRRASHAPTRSPHSPRPSSSGHARQGSGASDIQMSPDVERFVKRQAKQDKAADRTMNSMNRKLADMIQQAQTALGTKYAVEGDADRAVDDYDVEDTDEGFVDEEW